MDVEEIWYTWYISRGIYSNRHMAFKGTGLRDFCFWFLSRFIFPQASDNSIRVISNFFQKFAEIFTSQGAPPVSMTPGSKLSTDVNDTGCK
jgi:hypothetical protein